MQFCNACPIFDTMIDAQLNWLRQRLMQPLPGFEAQARMMPASRKNYTREFVVPENAKKSAVLILLYPNENQLLHFPLIERAAYPGVHSKQISFPGGAHEDQDLDFVATALRETEEEVGVTRESIEVLGNLSPLYIPPSNFWVQPVLGFVSSAPVWKPNPVEVDKLIETNLQTLIKGEYERESKIFHSSGVRMTVPSFVIDSHVVWGATAMMLSELIEIFSRREA